jgi:hypothetical protein
MTRALNVTTSRPRHAAVALGGLCGLLLAGQTHAALAIRAEQTSYAAAPGGTVQVLLRLVETGGTTRLQANGGLYSFGLSLSRGPGGDAVVSADALNPQLSDRRPGSTAGYPASAYQVHARCRSRWPTPAPGPTAPGRRTW